MVVAVVAAVVAVGEGEEVEDVAAADGEDLLLLFMVGVDVREALNLLYES